jgi:NADPH2:quinone reductase
MKTWRFHEFGDIRNLKMEEAPIPEPGPGEALLRVHYAALNPADAYLVGGQYPRAGKPPFAVGRDGSGTVAKAGERFREGERVVVLRSEIGVSREGTLSDYVAVPEESLAPLPDGWSLEEGAAAPLVFLTAWQALVDVGGLNPAGDDRTVLVTGASGGVGTAALLLAKAFGCRVAALSRSAEKRAALEELGADITLDSEDPELVERAKQALGGGRADVVVENLGGPYLQKSVELAGQRGRVAVVGLLAGLMAEIQVALLLFKQVRIEGVTVGAYSPSDAQERWHRIVEALDRSGKRPPVDRVFAADQVQEAFARLAEGPLGKVLVRFAE